MEEIGAGILFKVLSKHLSGGTEEKYEVLSQGGRFSGKIRTGILQTQFRSSIVSAKLFSAF
jgi:hypothetical protein